MVAQSPILATVTYKTTMGQNKKKTNTVARENPSSLHPTQKQIVKVQKKNKFKSFRKKIQIFQKKNLSTKISKKIKQKAFI